MTEGIKSRDLLKYGEAVSQGLQDGMKDAEQWRQYRERIISEAVDPASRASEALRRTVDGIVDFVRAMVELMAAVIPDGYISVAKRAAEIKVALNEAPPRVRHLAIHSKKKRVRNKNINRALREYRRNKNL